MRHFKARFTPMEIEMLAASIPDSLCAFHKEDVDHQGNWIACSSVSWHTDPDFEPWSALLLVYGKCTVETETGISEMEPGDVVVLNIHERHRARSPFLEQSVFLAYDSHEALTEEAACAGLRRNVEYVHAMQLSAVAARIGR